MDEHLGPDYIVDRITVSEDVGVHEPVYKRIRLLLRNDGLVAWEPVEENKPRETYPHNVETYPHNMRHSDRYDPNA